MKTIKCDLCKRELGKEVDIGSFISWDKGSEAQFYPDDLCIDSGFQKQTISDICSKCFKKIAEAQNKAIEEIRQGNE